MTMICIGNTDSTLAFENLEINLRENNVKALTSNPWRGGNSGVSNLHEWLNIVRFISQVGGTKALNVQA